MAGTRLRLRWRRLAAVGILGYLGFWSVVSIEHIITLTREEQSFHQKIAHTNAQNRLLQAEITQLKNPTTLKKIISGKQSLPTTQPVSSGQ